jgi:hypothetical protein
MEEPIEPRVEQRIEHNETKMDYNHHTLWLRSYALKAGGWIPKVVVAYRKKKVTASTRYREKLPL